MWSQAELIDLPFGLWTQVGRKRHNFNRIRQVAPMCRPMWAHWRHLANTIEIMLPSAHLSPQPKWQIDRFNCFCTDHGRKSILYNGRPFPPKLPFLMSDLDPRLIRDSLGLSEPTIQTASRLVQPFLCRWPQRVPVLCNGMPLALKIAPSRGGSGLQSNTWFPGPTTQTASQSVQPFLQGSLVWQTDWQTTLLGR